MLPLGLADWMYSACWCPAHVISQRFLSA